MNTRNSLDGRVAIVTGAASGIGLATAELLAARGAHLVLVDRDEQGLAAAANRIGAALAIAGDLTAEDTCSAAAHAAGQLTGQVDILVNCAGVAGENLPLWELSAEQFRRVLDLNLMTTFLMCRATVPWLRNRRDQHGRIINVASMAGKDGNPRASHYSAAKAGVIALTKSLGKELATDGVLVNAVAPAVVDTAMARAVTPEQLVYMTDLIPMRRLGTAQEIANLIGFLASDEMSFSTGAVFDASGGRATY